MALVMAGMSMGKIVDVIKFVGTGNLRTDIGVVRSFPDLWAVSYRGRMALDKRDEDGATRLSWLLPIRPGDLDETEQTETTLEFVE